MLHYNVLHLSIAGYRLLAIGIPHRRYIFYLKGLCLLQLGELLGSM